MSFQTNYPPSVTYHTSVQQKILSKNAANKYRSGSVKLRDLLREKFRIRVRDSRNNSFESGRNISGDGSKALVDKFLREELAELEKDINLQEEIYKELVEEFNEWFVEQLEGEENYLINVADVDDFFCPICQTSTIKQTGEILFSCDCGISFCFIGDLNKLRSTLKAKIDAHENKCERLLTFFVEPSVSGQNSLNAMCDNCDYFCCL